MLCLLVKIESVVENVRPLSPPSKLMYYLPPQKLKVKFCARRAAAEAARPCEGDGVWTSMAVAGRKKVAGLLPVLMKDH